MDKRAQRATIRAAIETRRPLPAAGVVARLLTASTRVFAFNAMLGTWACSGGLRGVAGTPGVSAVPLGPSIEFAFDSLDERAVTSESTRGKLTLIAFVNTSSLPAQAEVDYLVAMAKRDSAKVNYAVVALEVREERELVELYKKALSIVFPVALADRQTLGGGGPFGDVRDVPVTVLLDRAGRVVWRVGGRVAKSNEIRDAMHGI